MRAHSLRIVKIRQNVILCFFSPHCWHTIKIIAVLMLQIVSITTKRHKQKGHSSSVYASLFEMLITLWSRIRETKNCQLEKKMKANCMHWFHSGFERWLVIKNSEEPSEVSITQNSSDVVIVQCLISFILFIIPEVIMSWILEAATLLPPSAQCTNTKWSHCNYSFHAWEGTFSEVIWRAQRKEKNSTLWLTSEGWKISYCLSPKHLCHQNWV